MIRILFLIAVFFLFSCKNSTPKAGSKTPVITQEVTKNTKVKNTHQVKILTPDKNAEFTYNQELKIKLTKPEEVQLDSVQIFLNNKKIATTGKNTLEYFYKIPAGQPGHHTLRIMAFHNENERSTDSRQVIFIPDTPPVKYSYKVVNTYPHDPAAYTQGLVYHNGHLYEGTGMYGKSGLRKVDIPTGKTLSVLSIDSKLFGEGITIYNGKIYQITWTSGKGFVYDLHTFSLESTFTYNTQGWGITTMNDRLIMSDGSYKLYHIVPSSFSIIKEVEVYDHNGPVRNLNELEYINGLIWANIWMENRIVMIDPESGEVKGELDMTGLLPESDWKKLDKRDDVLNGIAWNEKTQNIYLTGKRWPKLFEITYKP